MEDGGTGFTPPFLKPKAGTLIKFVEETPVYIDDRLYNVSKDTAERYVRALCEGQFQFPPSVFCSRELEDGLNAYIEECIMALYVPTDDDLRTKAREILGMEHTAADNPKLLDTFKGMHVLWHTHANDSNELIPGGHPDSNPVDYINGVNELVSDVEQMSTMDPTAEFSARLGV